MTGRVIVAALTLGCFGLGYNVPAHAVGCISGGVAGAVAGHMMHHGVLGAVGGCIAGHEYHKHQQHGAMQNSNDQRSDYGYQQQQQQPQGYRNNE